MPSSASLLLQELAARNREYARRLRLAHVESHGSGRVVVYPPSESGQFHGNFLDASYAEILRNPAWRRRLAKVHAQARRSLPRPEQAGARKWCELDSSTSSDALLMNVFCYPGLLQEPKIGSLLNVPPDAELHLGVHFGFKPRVPRNGTTGDATEIDLKIGHPPDGLLIEAKLTESNFQQRACAVVEQYRDFYEVFDRDLLPRSKPKLRLAHDHDLGDILVEVPGEKYESYQMVRNILAAHALRCRLCVLMHASRTDLREQYHAVLRAVRPAELRTRCTLLTWQELAACVPAPLQKFLAEKYGIAGA